MAYFQGRERSRTGRTKTETPAPDEPMTLHEAAEITVRHWRLFGERGFDAAIDLLERVSKTERAGILAAIPAPKQPQNTPPERQLVTGPGQNLP